MYNYAGFLSHLCGHLWILKYKIAAIQVQLLIFQSHLQLNVS